MSNELNPCPFCGGIESLNVREVHRYNRYCADMYCIECRRCLYCTMNFDTKDELYAFWNTRPAEDAKDKEIEKLKSDLGIQKNLTQQMCFENNRAYEEADKWKQMFYDLFDKQAFSTDPKVLVIENAPVNCVAENGESAKQADLCCKSAKESEGEDE